MAQDHLLQLITGARATKRHKTLGLREKRLRHVRRTLSMIRSIVAYYVKHS